MLADDSLIAIHENILRKLGEQWNANEDIVRKRRGRVSRTEIELKNAKDQTAIAVQRDVSIRKQRETLVVGYENESDVPWSIVQELEQIARQISATEQRVAGAKRIEAELEERLADAHASAAVAQQESDRLLNEITGLKRKVSQISLSS